MGQLVILGAIVEPDWAELLLWSSFAVLNGALGLYSGLCRDRLEYMSHLPNAPSLWKFAPVLALVLAIIGIASATLVIGVFLLADAGASTLILFFFQSTVVLLDGLYTLMQSYLHWRERRDGGGSTSDVLYYATLLPELSMQLSRLCHYAHVWYVHGLSFSVIDVLLLANTKAAFEAFQQRLTTHLNFLRADSNLQQRFRSATREELSRLNDCCAICREPMEGAKVLPCGHFFHYLCLRSWLEQSHSCPICRASLTAPLPRTPRGTPRPLDEAGAATAAGNSNGAASGVANGAANGVAAATGAAATGAEAAPAAAPRRRRAGSVAEWLDAELEELVGGGDDDEGEGEDDEQSFLLFSTENWQWPSWLPRLHLEVIRRPSRDTSARAVEPAASTTEEELRQLREVFPHQTEGALRRALLRNQSLEAAIEALLVEM